MKSSAILYQSGEWRVYFSYNETWSDLGWGAVLIRDWLDKNVKGAEGVDWRLSTYSIQPYVAFLSEEDAILCRLAF